MSAVMPLEKYAYVLWHAQAHSMFLWAPPNAHSMVARQCFVGEVRWAAG